MSPPAALGLNTILPRTLGAQHNNNRGVLVPSVLQEET